MGEEEVEQIGGVEERSRPPEQRKAKTHAREEAPRWPKKINDRERRRQESFYTNNLIGGVLCAINLVGISNTCSYLVIEEWNGRRHKRNDVPECCRIGDN
ncbi:hypothetical protein S83_061664 [Arachis hypogaea]